MMMEEMTKIGINFEKKYDFLKLKTLEKNISF